MTRYCTEPRKREYIKGFLPSTRNQPNKCGKKLLDTATKTVIDAAKTASKNVVCKIAEVTGELARDKIAEKFVKPKPVPDDNSITGEEIVIPLEKRQETLKKNKKSVITWSTKKYLNY